MNLFEQNPIIRSISDWFKRNFSDPGAITLFMTLVLGLIFLELFGKMLMPVLISIIIAYLLSSVVRLLERWHFPHLLAVLVVYIIFVGLVIYAILVLLPMLWKELLNLISELPSAFVKGQGWIESLIRKYPRIFSDVHVQTVTTSFQTQTARIGQLILQYSLSTIPGVIQMILYIILVPLLVFFFLKDSKPILGWFHKYTPSDNSLVKNVWSEVHTKIGAYVRGRVLEIIVVGVVTSITFVLLGLQYAILLGALVGLSVIIPYIGATVVTVPVLIIALTQWGFGAHFFYVLIAYIIIIALDANVLVPILFSETMDLHPVVVILAVVVFGSFWGFWGVFFAIPLATLVHAVLKAWPRTQIVENEP